MRPIAILTYHSIDTSGSAVSVAPGVLADQMAVLADLGYRGVTLREATAYRTANGAWPDRCVVLTFDDGYASFHEAALPTLTRHGFTATVFLVSGHIGGRNDWEPPFPRLGTRAMLTWSQVAELSAAGMEIAAHTKTHPDLARLLPETAAEEIIASRVEIEEQLGQPIESFAYPYGSVSAPAAAIAAREFRAACTVELKQARGEAMHLLPRVDAYYVQGAGALARLVNGELDRYLALRRWARAVRRTLTSTSRTSFAHSAPAHTTLAD
jgi:peptidoglycan/xylan/chitin deacetylase (PgdA/CDA1 family)